jgi:DNA-binding beta-propeller fold protein YncE
MNPSRLSMLLSCAAISLAFAGCSPKAPSNTGESSATPNTAENSVGGGAPAGAPVPQTPLRLAGHVDIPGYTGDFDHFAYDQEGDRLFLAGEEGKRLLVFRLSTGELLKTITQGVDTPHSLLWMADRNELLVLDGGAKGSYVLDGATYAIKRTYKLGAPGADSVAYDARAKRLFVVTGGKDVPMDVCYLSAIDPATGKVFWSTKFEANHVEALVAEQQGGRIFINVTDKNLLAVLDKQTGKVLRTQKIAAAEQNAPIAMDEKNKRLFVVARKPGKTLVLNADTLATVAQFKAPERTDEVTWDPVNRRLYVTGGEGYVSVIEQQDADHYREVEKVPSGPGAKTAILSPRADRLYVAQSPGESGAMARLIWFDIQPRR